MNEDQKKTAARLLEEYLMTVQPELKTAAANVYVAFMQGIREEEQEIFSHADLAEDGSSRREDWGNITAEAMEDIHKHAEALAESMAALTQERLSTPLPEEDSTPCSSAKNGKFIPSQILLDIFSGVKTVDKDPIFREEGKTFCRVDQLRLLLGMDGELSFSFYYDGVHVGQNKMFTPWSDRTATEVILENYDARFQLYV